MYWYPKHIFELQNSPGFILKNAVIHIQWSLYYHFSFKVFRSLSSLDWMIDNRLDLPSLGGHQLVPWQCTSLFPESISCKSSALRVKAHWDITRSMPACWWSILMQTQCRHLQLFRWLWLKLPCLVQRFCFLVLLLVLGLLHSVFLLHFSRSLKGNAINVVFRTEMSSVTDFKHFAQPVECTCIICTFVTDECKESISCIAS